jgi:hypothetical protein
MAPDPTSITPPDDEYITTRIIFSEGLLDDTVKPEALVVNVWLLP